MLFLLATPEYTNAQSNVTKIRVHLRTGVAEIFDQHQDLMGKIENNLIEIETNFEGKVDKTILIVQDAVFIVSNQGLDADAEVTGTSVYVYAKRALEVNSSLTVDKVNKDYEAKQLELETTIANTSGMGKDSKVLLLEGDVEFFKKSVGIVKVLKG
jgi:F0F1-type ATP synthase epsilon subunit